MAFDVGVHIWFEQQKEGNWPGLFWDCISASWDSAPCALRLPLDTAVKIKVCQHAENRVVWEHKLSLDQFSELPQELLRFSGQDYLYGADLAFPCVLYSPRERKIEQTVHPLTLRLVGPEFDVGGYEHKRNGLIRISFSNVNVFRVPLELVEHTRTAVLQAGEHKRYMQMISEISRNFDIVLSLAKKLIRHQDPSHLMICTEWEVHPLTAHGLYHKKLLDFARDLQWITTLHHRGGLYLCATESRDLMKARRQSRDYGYLRDQTGMVDDFVMRLESRLSQPTAGPDAARLHDEDIRVAFSGSSGIVVEDVRESLIVCVNDGPFAYLEEPFFNLVDLAKQG